MFVPEPRVAYTYRGEQYDFDTGMMHSRGREYDPYARTFTTEGSLSADTNLYRRDGNQPTGVSIKSSRSLSAGITYDAASGPVAPGFFDAGGPVSNTLGAARDIFEYGSEKFNDLSLYYSEVAGTSESSFVSGLAEFASIVAAVGSGTSQGAANIVGLQDVPTLFSNISQSYERYAALGIGTWDATQLIFNPLTGLAEAIDGRSLQSHDFNQQLDGFDRWGRGIQSVVATAGTALGGVVGLRNTLGVSQIGTTTVGQAGRAVVRAAYESRVLTTSSVNLPYPNKRFRARLEVGAV